MLYAGLLVPSDACTYVQSSDTQGTERAAKKVCIAPQYKDAEEGAAYERVLAELLGEAPAHLPLLLERVRRLAKLEGDARTQATLQAGARAVCAAQRVGSHAAATCLAACMCTSFISPTGKHIISR